MIWLTWRQFRVSAGFVAIALAMMAILLALTSHGTEFLGLAHDHLLQFLSTLLVGLPALLGAFWGAPLITRELEAGTYRLAWTQSVTRTRWLAIKVGSIAVAGATVCGLLSLMLTSWSSTSISNGRLQPAMFAERGIAPIGYAVFALALGVVAGLLIRRTVPAMVATLLVFLGTRMLVQFGLRPHLAPQRHLTTAIGHNLGYADFPSGMQLLPPSVSVHGAWVLSTGIVDDTGHAPSHAFVQSACGQDGAPVQRSFHYCVTHVAARFHNVATYQPASHYWALQWAETGVYLALAAALIGISFWWVRRRLS